MPSYVYTLNIIYTKNKFTLHTKKGRRKQVTLLNCSIEEKIACSYYFAKWMTRSVFYFIQSTQRVAIIIITLKRSGHFHTTLPYHHHYYEWCVWILLYEWVLFFLDLYDGLVFSSGKKQMQEWNMVSGMVVDGEETESEWRDLTLRENGTVEWVEENRIHFLFFLAIIHHKRYGRVYRIERLIYFGDEIDKSYSLFWRDMLLFFHN